MTVQQAVQVAIGSVSVWDYQVFGPCSMDDELEIVLYIKRNKRSKKERVVIRVTDFDCVTGETARQHIKGRRERLVPDVPKPAIVGAQRKCYLCGEELSASDQLGAHSRCAADASRQG